MKTKLVTLLTLGFLTQSTAQAMPSSLSWNLLPENIEELPLEIGYDTVGSWQEIWLRPPMKPKAQPKIFMEQGLGTRWMGMNPDDNGKPSRVILVYNDLKVTDIEGEKTKTGKVEGGKVVWSDGTQSELIAMKKKRGPRKRSRRARKVHFGKINLPALSLKPLELNALSVEGLPEVLSKLPNGTSSHWGPQDYGMVSRLADGGSLLRLRYASDCSQEEKVELEKTLAQAVEPKLTCWAEQNGEKAGLLISALLQKPMLSCSLKTQDCGRTSLPLMESFFVVPPKIELNINACTDERASTLLHEVLHLAGIKDGEEMDAAITQANSCDAQTANLNYNGEGEEFFNDLQVETRLLLFKKVRDEAVEKWGWSEGEKSYVLGSICSKMGDKFCSRRFFQLATEAGGSGMMDLPEGGQISFTAAAHFGLFDSITEDASRMHELSKYLSRDPQGTLLKRLENGTHRMHEFYVVRNALEKVKNNKGVCNSEVEDRLTCDDLAQISKYPWFNK